MTIASYGQEFLNHSSSGEYGVQSTYLEGAVTYNRDFGKHYVDAMMLYNQRTSDTGEKLPYRNQGLAGRFSYSYDNRYVAEFNFGYNGSENFAKGYRFGFFPSVALGWIVSEEKFMAPVKDVISKLKLRGSYGLVGNDRINGLRFAYITTLGTNKGYSWGTDGSGGHTTQAGNYHLGRWEGHFGVPNLTWEESAKFNAGIELGMWNSLEIQADYFFERRSNIFMQRTTIPGSAGFIETPWANYGIVNNSGVDLALQFNRQFGRDWSVSLKGTFTFARNKIVEKDEAPSIIDTYRSYTGQSVSTLYGLTAVGLFTENDFLDVTNGVLKPEIPSHSYGSVRPGDIRYKDMNGDNVITTRIWDLSEEPRRRKSSMDSVPACIGKCWISASFFREQERLGASLEATSLSLAAVRECSATYCRTTRTVGVPTIRDRMSSIHVFIMAQALTTNNLQPGGKKI